MPQAGQLFRDMPFNNRRLFSDSFLLNEEDPARSLIRTISGWQEAVQNISELQEKIKEVRSLISKLEGLNEPQAEEEVIRPLLKILGWHEDSQDLYKVQPPIRGLITDSKLPDYVLFPTFHNKESFDEEQRRNPGNPDSFQRHAVAILEAKAPRVSFDRKSGTDKKSPMAQIDEYLHYSRVPWGILTDGARWRLVHRESSFKQDHFYEIDLYRLLDMSDEDPVAFLYFYLFFSHKALAPEREYRGGCLLDSVREQSVTTTTKWKENLKESVFDALTHLCRGYFEKYGGTEGLDPNNDSDRETVRNAATLLLYRILFILYAEATEILPVEDNSYNEDYGLSRLRKEIADRVDAEPDLLRAATTQLWNRLRTLFQLIDKGTEGIGESRFHVPAYNGGLFRPDTQPPSDPTALDVSWLNTHELPDGRLIHALDCMMRAEDPGDPGHKRFVAYQTFSVVDLGIIYESMMEFVLMVSDTYQAAKQEEWVQAEPDQYKDFSEPRKVLPGQVYLINRRGERKSTGSYFTPDKLVKYIVARTLEPLCYEKQGDSLVPRQEDEILSLRICDPAMGSGHFLVEACDYMARALAVGGLEEEGAEDQIILARRRVVEKCIYGVDLIPLTTELAKLSLWLNTASRGKALSFLDHHIRCGNSLLGATITELRSAARKAGKSAGEAMAALVDDLVKEAAEKTARYQAKTSETGEDVHDKEREFQEVRESVRPLRLLADAWLADRLGLLPLSPDKLSQALVDLQSGKEISGLFETKKIRAIAREYRFFHWELEFPEVYYLERPGFHATMGNPPWDKWKIHDNDFWPIYISGYRGLKNKSAKRKAILGLNKYEELERQFKEIDKAYRRVAEYWHGSDQFKCQGGGGDVDLYKMFTERFGWLLGKGGRCGVVLPSGILTDYGSAPLRKLLIQENALEQVFEFENRQKHFPAVDMRYKFAALIWQKDKPGKSFKAAFYRQTLDDLEKPAGVLFDYPVEDVKRFSPDSLSVMEFRSPVNRELCSKIYGDHPLLGQEIQGTWNLKMISELHMTNDSRFFQPIPGGTRDPWEPPAKYTILYEGKMFHQFNHKFAHPTYWLPEALVREHLAEKEVHRVEAELKRRFCRDAKDKNDCLRKLLSKAGRGPISPKEIKLDADYYRMGYRDISRSTDERTLICTVIPRGVFCGNKAPVSRPYEFNAQDLEDLSTWEEGYAQMHSGRDILYLISVLNSFTVDFIIRQKVSTTVNFFYLYQLPVPRLTEGNPVYEEIVKRAARLVCVGPEFDALREELGLPQNQVALNPRTRAELRAELDAIVARWVYGLNREEFQTILYGVPGEPNSRVFPLVDEGIKMAALAAWEEIGEG